MKLLLDQGLPRSSAALLREIGIETIHVGELDMSAAPDESIIEHARGDGFSIVTLDADFNSLIATASAPGPRSSDFECNGSKRRTPLTSYKPYLIEWDTNLTPGASLR